VGLALDVVDYPSSFSAMTLLFGSCDDVTRKIVSEMTYNVSNGTLNLISIIFRGYQYATAQSLPRRWCGPAASTRSADVLSTPAHHGSANGRPSLEAYPRCCSPPDSNPANWMAMHISGGINSWVLASLSLSLSAAWWQCHVHGERHDFSDVNITSPGRGCTWHAT